jgi:hypothetical protein
LSKLEISTLKWEQLKIAHKNIQYMIDTIIVDGKVIKDRTNA